MLDKPLAKLRARDDINEIEEAVLRNAISEVRLLPRNFALVMAGDRPTHCQILLDGMVARYKDLPSGQRQILQLHTPGDFVDLHGFALKRLDHGICTISPCRVAILPHARLTKITEEQPHLARVLWFSTALDAAIHREWMLSIGTRDAEGRIAHLFAELDVSLSIVGLSVDHRFGLPMTQEEIGEAVGITAVHTNRILKRLRDDRVLTFKSREAIIHDVARLRQIAKFDSTYLNLEKLPR